MTGIGPVCNTTGAGDAASAGFAFAYLHTRGSPLRPASGPFELGTHVFPRLVAAGELAAYTGDFPWIDVGTVEAYRLVYRGPTFDGCRWPISALTMEEP